ncbi:hypothetical protein DRF58_06150 [Epilithonimonas hispanica]|uniref:Uncharacterized protein n=1 Tax=Epilithonimonas hispanica TaxID=358687 RepID=A0A3D9D047_9FLAO|nr:hypothetical protein DRF58_06150 [Epilithonimonas hispanica]
MITDDKKFLESYFQSVNWLSQNLDSFNLKTNDELVLNYKRLYKILNRAKTQSQILKHKKMLRNAEDQPREHQFIHKEFNLS